MTGAETRGRLAILAFFLFRMPRKPLEYIISVDLSNIWRQHLVWSKKNGEDLKKIVTERFGSSTVFLSLLFSSEMGLIYSPSDPGKDIRYALARRLYTTADYWAGVAICFAIFFSVSALVANFTATAVFSSLSKENAPIVLRSSLGIYSAQLPSRLVTGAIYMFFIVVLFSWWVIMPHTTAILLIVAAILLLIHIVNTFSSMGRLIMDSGAMSHIPIIEPEEEEKLDPQELSNILLTRVFLARKADVPVNYQYKTDFQETLKDVKDGAVSYPLTHSELTHRAGVFRASMSTIDAESIGITAGVNKGVQSLGKAGKKFGNIVTSTIGSVPGSKTVANSIQSLAAHGTQPQMPWVPEADEENETEEGEDMIGVEVDVGEPEIEKDDGF